MVASQKVFSCLFSHVAEKYREILPDRRQELENTNCIARQTSAPIPAKLFLPETQCIAARHENVTVHTQPISELGLKGQLS